MRKLRLKRRNKLINLIPIFCTVEEPYFSPREKSLANIHDAKWGIAGFVEKVNVIKLKSENDRVMVTFPAPLYVQDAMFSDSYMERGLTKFSFGRYGCARNLLLVEDIEKWCHNKIEFDRIRNIYDFKLEMSAEAKPKKVICDRNSNSFMIISSKVCGAPTNKEVTKWCERCGTIIIQEEFCGQVCDESKIQILMPNL